MSAPFIPFMNIGTGNPGATSPLDVSDDSDLRHHVEFVDQKGTRAYWKVGTMCRIHQRPHHDLKEPPLDEKETLALVKESSGGLIPVPHIFHCWVDEKTSPGPTYFSLRLHIDGEPLLGQWETQSRWPRLSPAEKKLYVKQIHPYLQHLRKMQANYMGRVDETPLIDDALFRAGSLGHVREGPFKTGREFWNAMARYMSDIPKVTPEVLAQLGSEMPHCEPFTFTHASLDPSNFLVGGVNGDEVVGMIDWERAGYFPVWWEYVRFIWFCTTRPKEFPPDWRDLLLEGMEQYPEAFDWYRKVRNLWYLAVDHATTAQQEMALNTLYELQSKVSHRQR